MLACPNKSSKEWKEVLKEANGIEQEALKLWVKKYPGEGDRLTDEIEELVEDTTDTVGEEVNPDDTNTEFITLTNEIKVFLEKQLAILRKKVVKNQEFKEQRIKKILAELEGLDEAQAIESFITDSYNQSIKAEKRYDEFIKNKNKTNKKDVIKELLAFYEFANGYNILDEISKDNILKFFSKTTEETDAELIEQLQAALEENDLEAVKAIMAKTTVFDNKGKLTPQNKLFKALTIRNRLKNEFVSQGIPLMADFLIKYKSDYQNTNLDELKAFYQKRLDELEADNKLDPAKKNKRRIELKQEIANLNSFVMDKEGLEKLLKMSLKDEGVFDFLVGPLISSPDAVLALFAKAVKSQFGKAKMNLIKIRDEVLDVFEDYAQSSGKSKDNPKEFNEGMYEMLVSYIPNKEGVWEELVRPAFVQKYDITAFNKARNKFFSENPKPADDAPRAVKKAWSIKKNEWYAENTQQKPQAEIDEIIAEKTKLLKAGLLTQKEYDEWVGKMYIVVNNKKVYLYKEMYQPAEKYLNAKWLDMYNLDGTTKNKKGELHKTLTDQYFKSQEKIPKSQRLGYYVPYVPKTRNERIREKGLGTSIKKGLKDKFQPQVYDVGYESSGDNLDFEDTQGLSGQLSLASLGGAEVKFIPTYYVQPIDTEDISLDLTRSVLLFAQMAENYEALNEISAETTMLKVIVGDREVAEQTGKGQVLIDAFAQKQGYLKFISKNGESYSKKHLDAFIDMVVYGEMSKAEGSILGLDIAKTTDAVIGFSAITGLALDAMKGVANSLQGNIQIIIEAAGGQYFNTKNLAKGKKTYGLGTPFMKDFGKARPVSLQGQLAEYYDAMQGEFKDQYGRNVSNTAFLRLFNTNSLFFNMHAAEHEIQLTTMFALMDAERVIDNTTGEEMSLYEAHIKYGRDGVHDNTDFSLKRKEDFENRLHALNKRMQGVYNDFDKATAQRYALGRLALMYRKHLVPAFMRRYKAKSYDYELDDITEGFYRTFWNTLMKDLIVYKKNIFKEWKNYTPYQKAQIYKVLRELALIISFATLIFIMSSAADDDEDLKKSTAYNHIYYQLIRMNSETIQYYPGFGFDDIYKTIKSPTAATTLISRVGKFMDQFFLTWDSEKLTYKRDTGVWEKGDNKSWAYFLKIMGLTGNNFSPEEAVKNFENLSSF
jgi:hypothetical protein